VECRHHEAPLLAMLLAIHVEQTNTTSPALEPCWRNRLEDRVKQICVSQ
jgi:hypothetical protein